MSEPKHLLVSILTALAVLTVVSLVSSTSLAFWMAAGVFFGVRQVRHSQQHLKRLDALLEEKEK